ncbi:MAG: hypothetical protein Q8R45_02215 [Brevundimonas sp.]|uniref:hypothetical protein n=1 Tax=Brevundimonas sp. TaxID=1871086 RepID=UPI00271F99C0|nr:hypothetical protein [Brevundimonas sp.]MDO9588053.1 hypothetical protein [Brevundimonas sp.]MDP2765046.1 hypothetical protein [Brevundimonas sp.]MDP3369057.1 hypothetical protein [Brevundimonas sp.]MDP3655767.1 hypothetical protein [Brevundimonas sp.]MDZ4111148.1 hypothetical protein [Brevundimonas sp.]
MRRTVLAFMAVTALVAGCDRPAETPASGPDADAAVAPPPEMPADAPPQEEVDPALVVAPVGAPVSCLNDIGAEAAQRLVDRCIAVSPATRPPCNVANPCELIQGEIDRSCEMYAPGEAKPSQCAA